MIIKNRPMMTGMAVAIMSLPDGHADGDENIATGFYEANLNAYVSNLWPSMTWLQEGVFFG